MTPDGRRKILFKKKFCAQCLQPGVRFDEKHNCSIEYACPDNYHKNFQNGLHVLVCDYHKESKENQNLIEKCKINFIGKIPNLENFSKNISCYRKIA